MIALKTVITVLFLLQTGFTQSPSPVNMNDAPCPDDQNNCPSNSYCYIYSVTSQPYCVESCDLDNGGCGTGQCMMITAQCNTAPCPPMVQCHSVGSSSQSNSHMIIPISTSISHYITRTTSTLFIPPSPSSIPWPGPYTCSRQPESGPCQAYFPHYFYNVTSGRCEEFIYGGCGGNDNRFSTSEECYRTCGNFINICELDPETGICEAYIPSYFYNATSKRCEEFIYGGCGGNDNRFPTLEQCQTMCDIDVCILEPEAGNCRGSFLRYFYNKFTRRCELFVYGGCGGNGNRFIDIHICKKSCLTEPTITPTPVPSEKNIITIMFGSYDGDIDGLVADFTGSLKKILTDNGITDVSVQIVDVSYTPDNDVILSLAVYSDKDVISGEEIAALINQNKEMFTVPVSSAAVVGDDTNDDTNDSKTSDGLSGRALAGTVIGAIVGLILIMILTVGILYFINNRNRIITKHISSKKSDGLDNPIYRDDQME